jgi:AraC-like DNA-binding protein
MLRVHHAKPSSELAPYLYGYAQRLSEPDQPEIVEPVVARSGSMLEFQFGDPYAVPIYGVDLPNLSVPITIIGPIPNRFARVIIRGRVEALTVQFRPLGLYTIFGIPLSYFTGKGTEGGSVLGPSVRALFEELGNLGSFIARVQTLELFLTQRLRQRRSLHPANRALSVLTSGREWSKARQVAAQAGISTRQLERLSLEYTGISPVVLTRVARFQRALWLRQRTDENRTWIAHAANYHDQMHMIRDFRSLAGDTPERAIHNPAPDHLINFMCE